MNKLEIGMYCRTKGGEIDRIVEINDTYIKTEKQITSFYCYARENIVNSSFNIADLIQVGDYINGAIVTDIKPYYISEDYWKERKQFIVAGDTLPVVLDEMIIDIVTKEQFEQMKYEVK